MKKLISKLKFELKTAIAGIARPFIISAYKVKFRGKKQLLNGKKIAIYTSVYGQYDNVHPIKQQSINVDWICFTDRHIDAIGWRCEVKAPIATDNRKSAKWYKINASLIEELSAYDYTIYIDASTEVLSKYFAEIYLSVTDVIGFHRHPERNSVLREAEVSSRMVKYQHEDLIAKAKYYIDKIGCDETLWAGGVIVRKQKTPEFDAAWWEEMSKSLKDQISLPYAAYSAKVIISPLPLWQLSHIFIRFNVLHRLHEYEST